MELTPSFEILRLTFALVLTFRMLTTGWILSVRHRYATDVVVSSDSEGEGGHFSDYHRFFSQAVWDIDHLWTLLAMPIMDDLIGPVRAKAALSAPAPNETKVRRDLRRKKGERLKRLVLGQVLILGLAVWALAPVAAS